MWVQDSSRQSCSLIPIQVISETYGVTSLSSRESDSGTLSRRHISVTHSPHQWQSSTLNIRHSMKATLYKYTVYIKLWLDIEVLLTGNTIILILKIGENSINKITIWRFYTLNNKWNNYALIVTQMDKYLRDHIMCTIDESWQSRISRAPSRRHDYTQVWSIY